MIRWDIYFSFFPQGVTKKDGTKIPAGEIKRHALETMDFFVEGIVK